MKTKLSIKQTVTKEQMAVLDSLIPCQTTTRFSDSDPVFQEPDSAHVASMLFDAALFTNKFGLERVFSPWHANAIIKAHDLTEMGLEKDFTVLQCKNSTNIVATKKEYEQKMRIELGQKYGPWLPRLCEEYEAKETNAAKFVGWLDKYNAIKHVLACREKATDMRGILQLSDVFNGILKNTKADFLKPLTLDVLCQFKPYFQKDGLTDYFNRVKGDLTRDILGVRELS